jgi:hypothetical protein
MVAYQKLIFPELNKDKVVNRPLEETETFSDSHHKALQEALSEGLKHDNENLTHELSDIEEASSEGSEGMYAEEIQGELTEIIPKPLEETIDLDSLKLVSFNEGYQKAKVEYEEELQKLKAEVNFQNSLSEQVNKLDFKYDLYEANTLSESIEILKIMLSKLHKHLPNDFNQLLSEQLNKVLKNNRIEAQLIIKFNNVHKNIVTQIIEALVLSEEAKKHIKLEEDTSLTIGDCQVFYKDATFEFNEEKIITEIEKIIENILIKNS